MTNYKLASTKQIVMEMLDHISRYEYLAYDVESTGLNVRTSKIIGFAVTGAIEEGYYFPIYEWDVEKQQLIDVYIEGMKASTMATTVVRELIGKKLIMHNGSYDIQITLNDLGVDLLSYLFIDTIVLVHAVREEGFFALKEIAVSIQDEIGFDVESAANEEQIALKENVKKNGGEVSKGNFELYKADLNAIWPYAVKDVDLTLRVCKHYWKKLKTEGLERFFFEEEVMPLLREVTIPMEQAGVGLDMSYIREVDEEITKDIETYRERVVEAFKKIPAFRKWSMETALKVYPPSNKGNFAQAIVKHYGLDLPTSEKTGKYSMTKKTLEALPDSDIKHYLLSGEEEYLPAKEGVLIAINLWIEHEGGLVNIQSKKQLGEIAFQYMKIKPLSKTEKGADQFNDDLIDHLSEEHEWAKDLKIFNKLVKIKSSYVDRYLERNENGRYFFYYKQHGTISGRYASDAQQLPRKKEDGELEPVVLKHNNAVRAFFIPDPEYIFIDCDYETLEPRVFAHVAADKGLIDIFLNGWDFYSTIAIKTEKIPGVSADKKADNYLGKVNKPARQKAKAYCFSGDTLVNMGNGLDQEIKNVKVGDLVRTPTGGIQEVLEVFSKEAETYLIHTNRGTLECTPDHKFFTDGKWVEAQYLKIEDKLEESLEFNDYEEDINLPIMSNFSFKNGGNKPLGYLKIDEDWAYFIGALLGDGVISISQADSKNGHGLKGYVGICGDPKDMIVCKIEGFMNSLGYTLRTLKESTNCITRVVANSEMAKIVYDTLQLGDMTAEYKKKNLKIPSYLFKASKSIKLSFIAGLFDTDGYVKGKNGVQNLAIVSKDFRLSTGLIRLLKSLDVECSYCLSYNKTYSRNYYLVRVSRKGIRKLSELGLYNYMVCDRKKTAVLDAINYIEKKGSRRVDNPKVIGFERTGITKQVYDITVRHAHCFFANGILVHNCLGIPYGMSAYALGLSIGVPQKDAEQLVEGYLSGFPELRSWMSRSAKQAKELGYMKTQVGRIRHLTKVKAVYDLFGDSILNWDFRRELLTEYEGKEVQDMYMDYKNGLNNARNFQIQGLAASIVNRAMIEINREFKKQGIDGKVVAQIHDQIIVHVRKDQSQQAKDIVRDKMENTTKLSLPLPAPPEIAINWRDGH